MPTSLLPKITKLICILLYSATLYAAEISTKEHVEQTPQKIPTIKQTKPEKKEEKKEVVAENTTERQLRIKKRIFFGVSSAQLTAQEIKTIKSIEAPKTAVVIVAGYADPTGETKFNLNLSRRRAYAVYRVLKKHLGPEIDLRLTYFGESKMRFYNRSKRGRQLNRSAEIKVFY